MDMGAGVSLFVSVTPIETYQGLFLVRIPFVYDDMCEVYSHNHLMTICENASISLHNLVGGIWRC